MKTIFKGNETVDVSVIQSASVVFNDEQFKVCVKHKAEDTGEDKISYLAGNRVYYYEKGADTAAEVAKDLEALSNAPDTPIDQVIVLAAWRCGYLQVMLDPDNDMSVEALAKLCWHWRVRGRKIPTPNQLKLRTGLSVDEIKKIADTDIYEQIVETLMLEARTPDEFKKWVETADNLHGQLSKRMRLSEHTVVKLVNSVARQLGVDLT